VVPTKPQRSFKATKTGGLPSDTDLVPNEHYAIPPRAGEPVSPFDDREKLIAWMRDAVLGDLRTLERGILTYLGNPAAPSNNGFAGGNYLLASGCFLALEYFAQVYRGKDDATANVRSFTSEFLKFNTRYVEVGDVVWRAFRNGLVHGGWPKVLSIEGMPSETIELMIGVRPDDPHLAPFSGQPNSFCLNAVQLLRDLETVVNGEFARWLRETADDVLNRGAPRRLEISSGFADGIRQFELIRQWNGHAAKAG
jgi:hypothetical protein